MMDDNKKITEDELNDVAGGRLGQRGNGAGWIWWGLTKYCDKSPDKEHFYELVGSTNIVWKFNLIEHKCKYCGRTSHELGADPLYH